MYRLIRYASVVVIVTPHTDLLQFKTAYALAVSLTEVAARALRVIVSSNAATININPPAMTPIIRARFMCFNPLRPALILIWLNPFQATGYYTWNNTMIQPVDRDAD